MLSSVFGNGVPSSFTTSQPKIRSSNMAFIRGVPLRLQQRPLVHPRIRDLVAVVHEIDGDALTEVALTEVDRVVDDDGAAKLSGVAISRAP